MTTSTNRVAIVTGASRGIGAAIARRLASDGLTVVVNYAGGADAAARLAAEIEKAGGRAVTSQADVSDPQAMRRMFDSAETAYGGVDVLVNNAGVMKLAPLAQFDDAAFDQTIAVNLKGAFNGMREAARRLRDGGRIVNLSTSVVGLYQPTYGVYAATKAAIEALTHVLAKELGPRRIAVNAIAPGPVATELFMAGKSDDDVKPIVGRTPLGRLGEPEDIARAVSFLVGPDGAWINGQVLRANGGII
jgi:3-oxoacyl-[acyl-carrier protein] reductase